jgi:metallo-beta-lactamase family protein
VRRGLMLTHGEPDSVGALRAAISLWNKDTLPLKSLPQIYAPRLDEFYALNHPHPKLLKTPQVQKRLDRYAEAEAVSGHDWHNDYARLMLQVQAQLHAATSDVERRRLLKKMQRVLGR